MFGIFYGLINLGCLIKKSLTDEIHDYNEKKITFDNESETWIDHYGNIRLANNHRAAIIKHHKTKDVLIIDAETGEFVKNLSYIKRNNAMNDGKTVIEVNGDAHRSDKIVGIRYMDKNTKNIYVIRYLYVKDIKQYRRFYMDLNGFLVRLTDFHSQLQDAHTEKFITEFNNKQKENAKKDYYNYNDSSF